MACVKDGLKVDSASISVKLDASDSFNNYLLLNYLIYVPKRRLLTMGKYKWVIGIPLWCVILKRKRIQSQWIWGESWKSNSKAEHPLRRNPTIAQRGFKESNNKERQTLQKPASEHQFILPDNCSQDSKQRFKAPKQGLQKPNGRFFRLTQGKQQSTHTNVYLLLHDSRASEWISVSTIEEWAQQLLR